MQLIKFKVFNLSFKNKVKKISNIINYVVKQLNILIIFKFYYLIFAKSKNNKKSKKLICNS